MNIHWSTNERLPYEGTVVTVGTFDGVHLGHQHIITQVREYATKLGVQSLLFTFEPHPKLVISKPNRPQIQLLTSIEEKIEVLEKTGLDSLVVSNFTKDFASTSAEDFVRNILVGNMAMKAIVLGHDHAFGRNREGNQNLLERLGRELGFDVYTVEPIVAQEENISSTRVRQLLLDGNVSIAKTILGRPYNVRGQVVQGKGVGKELGFPTANIRPATQYKLIPKEGIYTTRIRFNGTVHNSVTYIGLRPTFNGTEKVIEVHVHDFDADLYGKEVEVYFYEFQRADRKFSDTSQLIEMITKDKQKSMRFFDQGGSL